MCSLGAFPFTSKKIPENSMEMSIERNRVSFDTSSIRLLLSSKFKIAARI